MAIATKTPPAPTPPKAKQAPVTTPKLDAGLQPASPYTKSDIALILGLLKPPPQSSFNGAAVGEVKAQTDPLIKEITDSITGSTKAGQQAIAGYTGDYMKRIGDLEGETKGIYDEAKQESGAATASIGQYLNGVGGGVGDDVAAKLGAINAGPAAAQLGAAETSGTAKIGGGAATATGASGLERLIEQGSSAEAAGKRLPAIGALAGEQAGKEFGLQQGKSLSDQIGAVTAQVPAMIEQAVKDLRSEDASRRSQAASLVQALMQSGYGNELQKAIARQGYQTEVASDKNQGAQFNANEINQLTNTLNSGSGTSGTGFTVNENQNAVTQAGSDAYAAAQALFQPQPTQVGTSADGRPIYRSKSGGRTFDSSQAATTKQAPKFSTAYKQVFNRILPELNALDPTNARRIADQITRQQLAAAGINPPAKKS